MHDPIESDWRNHRPEVGEIEVDMLRRTLTLSGITMSPEHVDFAQQYPVNVQTGMDRLGELEEKALWIQRQMPVNETGDLHFFTNDPENKQIRARITRTPSNLYCASLIFAHDVTVHVPEHDGPTLTACMAELALLPENFRSADQHADMYIVVRVNTRRSLDAQTPAFSREVRALKWVETNDGTFDLIYHPLGRADVEIVLGNIIDDSKHTHIAVLRTMRGRNSMVQLLHGRRRP